MEEDKPENENRDKGSANEPANPAQEGGEPVPNTGPAAARIAELNEQLESLRAETDRQLAGLRSENAAQLAAYTGLARSLQGLVPELVGGSSLEAVNDSLVTAREAYSRIAANLAPVPAPGGENNFGPLPGAGGGTRSGHGPGEDPPAKLASARGVNLIYQALAGGKNGDLAR